MDKDGKRKKVKEKRKRRSKCKSNGIKNSGAREGEYKGMVVKRRKKRYQVGSHVKLKM